MEAVVSLLSDEVGRLVAVEDDDDEGGGGW